MPHAIAKTHPASCQLVHAFVRFLAGTYLPSETCTMYFAAEEPDGIPEAPGVYLLSAEVTVNCHAPRAWNQAQHLAVLPDSAEVLRIVIGEVAAQVRACPSVIALAAKCPVRLWDGRSALADMHGTLMHRACAVPVERYEAPLAA